jgi:hypothetical protein
LISETKNLNFFAADYIKFDIEVLFGREVFIKVVIELIEKIHFAFGGLVFSLGIHFIKVVIEFSNDLLLGN